MPNQITSAGLEVKKVKDVIDSLVADLKLVYGDDINVDPSSPDGQLINIFAQVIVDNLELLVDVNNSFSPDSAYGVLLDQRVALNGIARRPGTFTFTDVIVTVDRALTLSGLDAELNNPDGTGFTVYDDAGNDFILAETHVFSGAGSATLSFRSKKIGRVETTPNTITNQRTVVLGVTAVNNPAVATSIGENEETDLELKIRRAKSFKLAATGPADAVAAALLETEGVTDAFIAENDTSGTVNGIPARSLWCIVEGGTDADVAQAIYSKKMPGCGMTGSEVETITRPAGNTVDIKFDRPISEDLYIQFTLVPRSSGVTFDTTLIKQQIADALTYKIAQVANIGDVAALVTQLVPNGTPTDLGVSNDGITYAQTLAPTDFQHKFVVDAARIDIIT